MTRHWKQPNCSTIYDWYNKLVYNKQMKYYIAIKIIITEEAWMKIIYQVMLSVPGYKSSFA